MKAARMVFSGSLRWLSGDNYFFPGVLIVADHRTAAISAMSRARFAYRHGGRFLAPTVSGPKLIMIMAAIKIRAARGHNPPD
jgi:hypothetical protein